MSAEMDPSKMKVVDLRQELAARGLDTKGNKPVLVKRLKDALELELKRELPDTSIADTSTEDLDSSQLNETREGAPPDKTDSQESSEEKMETEDSDGKTTEAAEQNEKSDEGAPEQNGEQASEDDKAQADDGEKAEPGQQNKDQKGESAKEDGGKKEEKQEQKGEKRRRSSTSPERAQRRRSRSPVKEDEPEIDENKVQLSWYDSDLHLQVDKENFLSAKPYYDGAFGYIWAGARATHGVSSGKVHYEVKITEELKWEDLAKKPFENRRDRYKYDSRKNKDDSKKKAAQSKKAGDSKEPKEKTENGEVKAEEEPEKKSEEGTEKSAEEKETKETESADDSKPAEEQTTEEKPAEDSKPAEDANKTEDEKMEVDTEPEKAEKDSGDKNEEKDEKEAKDEKQAEDEKEAKDEKVDKDEKAKDEKEGEPKEKKDVKPIASHLLRVGWSIVATGLQLGEEKYSYGYESSGKFVTDKEFKDFGKTFALNDVVGAYLDMNEEFVKFIFTVNDGEPQEALVIPRSELPEEFVLFPHILSRNYAYEINLGSKDPWFPIPESLSDYIFIDKAEDKVVGPSRPLNRSDCEVILMFGLPAAGKTHWVRNHVGENAEKRYTVIGNSHLLDRMTVEGTPLKKNFTGRWNFVMDKTQKCLNELIQIAALRRRNYIIDQTNVFPSAQRRKLRPFEGFKRSAVVVVVGDEEQAKRQSQQEAQDGKDMPESAVLELKANMTLPEKNAWIDEVLFVEMNEEDAKAQVKKYNTQGRQAGYGAGFRKKPDDRRKYYNVKRLNDRGRPYRDRFSRGYDRGSRQNWYADRSGGARGWDRDRRDSRSSYSSRGSSRDWRSSGGSRSDRGNRDSHSSYGRSSGGGGRSGSWQSSGGGGWGSNQGNWNSNWGGGQVSWSGQGQGGNWGSGGGGGGSWKGSGGGSGYGGQGGNWNYYGQYSHNWGQSRKK